VDLPTTRYSAFRLRSNQRAYEREGSKGDPRTLRVIGMPDDNADQPPVLIVEDAAG
jgi:hypothetical protein